MYSVHAYGKMITDTIRLAAYEEALRRAVRPGAVVLDIGTGTGIHALMAARLGARHVYAVEPADSVELAPAIARDNGLGDAITFIRDFSTNITLPERVDVVVSDLHGTMPWFNQHIPTIVDARRRFLADDGILLPQHDRVFAVPVEAPELFSQFTHPWTSRPFGFDLSAVSRRITHGYVRGRVERERFLSDPALIAELDYRSVDDPNVHTRFESPIARDGTLHGFMVWFDTVVFEDVTLTSAPYEPEISYGSTFFPFSQPVDVSEADVVSIELRGVLHDDYVWIWNGEVKSATRETRQTFRHNTLQAALLSMDDLRKRAPSYAPALSNNGRVDRTIMEMMDGRHTLSQIADRIQAQYPDALPSDDAALERVRMLASRYS